MLASVSRSFSDSMITLGETFQMVREFVISLLNGHFEWNRTLDQIEVIGQKSLLIVFVTSLSIGMVMTMQFGFGLEKFGGTLYVPKIVTLSIFKELGPVFTSIILAARVGSGMASEIGSMVVTQQIDALRALGTSPIHKVVVPRVLACLICLPLLIAFANFFGVVGGVIIGESELRLPASVYLMKVFSLNLWDYLDGFVKSIYFSFCVSIPACYYGLKSKNGTQEVGQYTTQAVVMSCFWIFIGDFVLSKLLWTIHRW